MVALQSALLLTSVALTAGQLFDCRKAKRMVVEGDSIVENCQRLVCKRGDLEADGCEISNACRGRCGGAAAGGGLLFRPPFLVKIPGGQLGGVIAPAARPPPPPPPPPPPLVGRFPVGTGGSCSDKGRPVASGQVIEVAGCRQLSCRDGVLTTKFCEEVPPACTVAKRDTSKLFPGCCPVWSCVGSGIGRGGAGSGGVGFVGSGSVGAAVIAGRHDNGSCIQGIRPMANGLTVFGPGCVKYVCSKGVLTTHGCSAVPPGCTGRPPAIGKLFPTCCTRWRCTGYIVIE